MHHARTLVRIGTLLLAASLASACGRAPSRTLRQGQLPVYDFPLYLTEGATGTVWKYEITGTRTALITGLDNPLDVATDRFNQLYVVERGANRVWKFNAATGEGQVIREGLQSPSVIAVDSVGEAFVAQDTTHDVIRIADGRVVSAAYSLPSALVFGVEDSMIVGDYATNTVTWGGGGSATVAPPVNAAIDGMGRVYVAEGISSGARVLRFHQREPGGAGTVVADFLQSPQGIAIDAVGNVYIVEKGQSRITLVTYGGSLYNWSTGLTDPQYLAFTQY